MTTEAFKSIILPHQNLLLRVAFGVLGDQMEAEDVVQEVFIKLWDQRDSLETIENIKGWCVRMTKNKAIDRFRSRNNRLETSGESLPENGHSRTPYALMESQDTVHQIHHLIRQLPDKQQEVMWLREVESYSYQEISDLLQIPMAQVKVNIHRARKTLQSQLKHYYSYSD
jgi:RNA polymerase sigma factor (sigma-70 family)